MPLMFTLPVVSVVPVVVDKTDLSGEDVSLRGGDLSITSGGDWAILRNLDAARQSIEREAVASPGDMPRRPTWGMGLRDALMRNSSRDSRDRQSSSIRRRLVANPRISQIKDISVKQRDDLSPGAVTIEISASVNGQAVLIPAIVQPRKAT